MTAPASGAASEGPGSPVGKGAARSARGMIPEWANEAGLGAPSGGPPLVGHPWVVLGAASLSGSAAPSAPLPALVVCGAWLALWAHRWLLAFLGIALFSVTALRVKAELSSFQKEWRQVGLNQGGPRRCALRVVVEDSPIARTALSPSSGLHLSFTGRVLHGDCEGNELEAGLLVRLTGPSAEVARGDRLDLIAQLAPVRLFRNAALPSPLPLAARRGAVLSGRLLFAEMAQRGRSVASHVDRARNHVRERILRTYRPRAAGLGRALVLGENDLDEQELAAFRDSGLLHLLAVSGTHLVIAVLAIVQGLRALLVRIGPLSRRYDVARWSGALGAGLSLLYADFSGGSGSAWRAAFMLCLVLGARGLGRKVGGAGALGGSLIAGCLIDPLLGQDLSFLLSALATAGLIGLGQPLGRLLERGPLRRAPWRQLMLCIVATVSSTLFCAPALALIADQMTVAALWANVIAGPLGELMALPACLLHAVVAPWPALERGLAQIGSGSLLLVRRIALWSAAQTEAQFGVGLPGPWLLVRMALTVVGAAWATRGVRAAAAALGGGLVVLWGWGLADDVSRQRPEENNGVSRLTVTALDVGQGDAMAVDLPDGRLAIVDGGGFAMGLPDTARRVLLPYLRSRSRERVDLMVVSHAHPDHIEGLQGVMEEVPVTELWHPEHRVKTPSLQRLIARAEKHGTTVRGPDQLCPSRAGRAVSSFGGARIEVLLPCHLGGRRAFGSEGPLSEPWGLNDGSLVLRIRYGQRAFLLTGDIEARGEERLMDLYVDRLSADVLKVAHHGSDTSTGPEILQAVNPSLALISSGVRNRFEHPRPATLRRLHRAQVQVLRTDQLGSVSVTTDGKSLIVRCAAKMPAVGTWKKARAVR